MLKWKLRSERDCWTFSSSLCYGVEIKNGEDDNVDALDAAVCPMKDCKSKTTIQGKNLTRIVGDLRLKVPCKNRDAGCTHKWIEDEMEEHQDKCEDRKVSCDFCRRNVPFKDLLHHLRDKHKVDYDAKKWLMEEPTEKIWIPWLWGCLHVWDWSRWIGFHNRHHPKWGPFPHRREGNGRKASLQEVQSWAEDFFKQALSASLTAAQYFQ